MTGHGMEWWATALLWLALHPWALLAVPVGVVTALLLRRRRAPSSEGGK